MGEDRGDLATVPGTVTAPAPRSVPAGRLLVAQAVYAFRDTVRNPVMTVVVLGFPVIFLLMLGVASDATDPVTGAPAIQVSAPIAAVFATTMAAFVLFAFQVSDARERGILKRLRGSPLPLWTYVAGRATVVAAVAIVGTALMMAVAVVAFDLAYPWSRTIAVVVALLAGVAAFTTLGFAAAMLLRTSEATLTATMGALLLTAFASGTFAPTLPLPRVLDVTTWFLPLRHLSAALGRPFDPATVGAGFAWAHVAALLAFAALGAVVAVWRLSWDPAPSRVRATQAGRSGATDAGTTRRARSSGRFPTLPGLAVGQLTHAVRQTFRQPGSIFFAVAFPALFVVVVPFAFGQPELDGVPLARIVAPAMAVFGAVITAYVNLPEQVAVARDKGILKRLRGTPMPASAYVVGRIAAAVVLGLLAAAGAFVAGWLVHGVAVPLRSLPALLVVFVLGIPALAALGLTIVALTPDAGAVPAVALATFMPLAFVSDILAFGMELPGVLQTIGWLFPFKHLSVATRTAFETGTVDVAHLAVVLAWGAVAAAVATWRFRWEADR